MRRLLALLVIAVGGMATPLLAGDGAPQPTGETSTAKPPVPTMPIEEVQLGKKSLRMTVPVTIADQGPYDFVIDTGAERSVLSRELAQTLGLNDGPMARLTDFAGSSMVSTVKVPMLTTGKLATSNIEAPSLLMANIGAQGMLGIDALQGHKVVLDFDRKRMLLSPAKKHAMGDVVVRASSRSGQLIITKAWFEGKPIAVMIDTGSWLSVGNKAMLALARRQPRLVGPISIESVTGRFFKANYVTIDGVKIGGITFDDFGLSFADVPPFDRLGLRDKPALILGLGSLQAFRRVELDFVNHEIAFSLPVRQIDIHDPCRAGRSCTSLRGE
jgi:predicted aspartyl protease